MPLVLIVVLSYFTRFYPSKTKKKRPTAVARGSRRPEPFESFFFLGFYLALKPCSGPIESISRGRQNAAAPLQIVGRVTLSCLVFFSIFTCTNPVLSDPAPMAIS